LPAIPKVLAGKKWPAGPALTSLNYNNIFVFLQDSDYFKKLQSRHNVILLGDSVGDLHMCDGLESPEVVLKIGFLNVKIEERLETYLDKFDIVLVDDQTMNVPLDIVKMLSES
jgi:HAD superfamily hydrolase (TIGR01544 family)